jgi:hypothetical protein
LFERAYQDAGNDVVLFSKFLFFMWKKKSDKLKTSKYSLKMGFFNINACIYNKNKLNLEKRTTSFPAS